MTDENIFQEGKNDGASGEELPVEQLSDSAFYRMFVKEVRAKTSGQKEVDLGKLYGRFLDGDCTVSAEILEAWLMRVLEIARLYKEEPVQAEDVVQEGNMGLWLALREPPAGLTAETMDEYLAKKVRESMEAYIREMTGEIDREQSVIGKAALLYGAREHLAKENGVVPSNRELSAYTHIPVEEIRDILALMKTGEETP